MAFKSRHLKSQIMAFNFYEMYPSPKMSRIWHIFYWTGFNSWWWEFAVTCQTIFFLLLSFRIWKLFWEFSLISGSIIGSVKNEGCEGTPVSTKILLDCRGQVLKAPPLKSSGLHISVLKCNCWIYHANIGLRLIYPSFAFTTGLLKCQNQLQ